jgi:chorismate mutase
MSVELKLNNLRSDLSTFNLEFLEFTSKRQILVNEIQKTKKTLGKVTIWDSKQEFRVFTKIVSLQPYIEVNYLYMLSMLIEIQASELFDYPMWSKGEHLNSVSGKITDFMNPILLYIVTPDVFNSLDLKSEFKDELEKLSGE